MNSSKILTILSLFSAFLFSSCATLRGEKQRMTWVTHPRGAKVYFEGSEIGQTPAFLEIPRRRASSVSLVFPEGQKVDQPLVGSYRWVDSFLFNFVWAGIGAPIGWAIDYLTGAAWEYEPIPPIQTAFLDPKETPARRLISVAPPLASPEVLSDELGMKLVERMKGRAKAGDQVRDFHETQGVFSSYSYDSSHPVNKLYQDRLYFELGSSHILETQAERQDGGILLHARLVDAFTREETDRFSETVPYSELKNGKTNFWTVLSSLSSIVPNTIFFDYSRAVLYFPSDFNALIYSPVTENKQTGLEYLASFSIRNTRSPRLNLWNGVFRFIPDANLYNSGFHFDRPAGSNSLSNASFRWISLSAGVGAEAGLESPLGYFYLDLVPSLAMNWVVGPTETSSLVSLEWVGELGYSVFLSDRIAFRFFWRGTTGSASQWGQILSQASGDSIKPAWVFQGMYGLAVGFYFPESKSIARKTFY